MNLIKHALVVLLLDAGVALAFGGHESASATSTALPLCSPPVATSQYSSVEPEPRSTRTPTEYDHED